MVRSFEWLMHIIFLFSFSSIYKKSKDLSKAYRPITEAFGIIINNSQKVNT